MTDTEKIDAKAIIEGMNGFDEIAIQNMFRAPIDDLKGTLVVRAVLFIVKKREGMRDKDAFNEAMTVPASVLNDMFLTDEDEEAGKDERQPESALP